MNKDINVAEILKTKEKGTKLYDIVRDIDVYLYNIVGKMMRYIVLLKKMAVKY